MNLSKLQEMVEGREAWYAAIHGVAKSWTRLSEWKTTTTKLYVKLDSQWKFAVWHRELCSISCNNMNGKRIWKRIDSCIMKKSRHMYSWITLLYTWNYHNTVNQLCECYSAAKSCLTLCGPMDYSMPGSSVLHHLLEFVQIHVHWVSDATQTSHPLSPPSFPFNLSQ